MCGRLASWQRISASGCPPDQRQGHARIGSVEEAALASMRSQWSGALSASGADRAGHEIRHHRVERHAIAGDQDAGLAGGAEGRALAALSIAFSRHSAVYICPPSSRCPPPAPACRLRRLPLAIGRRPVGYAHRAGCPSACCPCHQLGLVAQQVVQAGGEIETRIERPRSTDFQLAEMIRRDWRRRSPAS